MRVAGAVFRCGDAVLVARRKPGKSSAGYWEFPGGKVEGAETPEEALIREIREELGYEIQELDFLDDSKTLVGELEIELVTFQVALSVEKVFESTDHDALEWVKITDLLNWQIASPDIPAVKKLQLLSK